MYDEASLYYSLNPSAQPQGPHRPPIPKHNRRQSLLDKPSNETDHVDDVRPSIPQTVLEETFSGPPEATLKRRARSYTDFHYAVTAVLQKEAQPVRDKSLFDERSSSGFKTEIEFVKWYEGLEKDVLESGQGQYKDHLQSLQLSETHLENLLADTDSALALLDTMTRSFKDVDVQTSAFQSQCEGLLKEQSRIEGLAESIDHNMKFYNYLEPATRRLNAPSASSFVRNQEFSEMLARIDDCLEYMQKHPTHRESSTYLARFRLLMTRGLTLVRNNFISGIREIGSEVSKRIADGQLKDATMSALLYAKFRVGAADLKAVAQEIRKRAVLPAGAEAGAEAEYQSLMNELYTSYSATRGRLVIPLARKKIADIAISPSTSKDLVAFARSSVGYIRGVCSDEQELWKEWFEGEDGLYDFLESVCEPLYDHLRPRIIHESQLLKLCELCTLLQTRYMHNHDEEAEPIDVNQLDFSLLVQPALEDAQTRLVFRAQTIMRDDIERYRPKKEELDYPSRNRYVSLSGTKSQRPTVLSGRKSSMTDTTPLPKTPTVVEESDSPRGRFGFETEAALEGWYPTLRKAVWLLSRIYRLVNSVVFDDLAHTIVHATTLSLISASQLIVSTNPSATPHDARLFLIKHLLLLKHQILAFDIEYVQHPDTTLDFSLLSATITTLRNQGAAALLPANIWRLLATTQPQSLVPKVVSNMLDAKTELDSHLRTVINDFTHAHASLITQPLDASNLAKPRFDPLAAVSKVKEQAAREIPLLRRRVDLYLDDTRTRQTLVAAVRDQVLQDYENFYDAWMDRIRKEGNKRGLGGDHVGVKSKKGKGREDEVWDMDMFGEWLGTVFGVPGVGLGLMGVEAGDGDGNDVADDDDDDDDDVDDDERLASVSE